jgi:hypothetical protein
MGLNDVFDNLKRVTCEAKYQATVEWLGCPWGHAVAPSTLTRPKFSRQEPTFAAAGRNNFARKRILEVVWSFLPGFPI